MPTKTRIVRIGNSQGIRVPRALMEQADLREEVELQSGEASGRLSPWAVTAVLLGLQEMFAE